MVTGELRGQVDRVWNAFWSGGIANPVEVIEQITYLLFIKRLDELHTRDLRRANRTGTPVANPVFPDGADERGRPYDDYRWSVFTNREPGEMFEILDQHVFPYLRARGAEGSSYARNMKDVRFTIPTAALLAKVVDLLSDIPMDDRDTKGDIYEYMLGKLATSGTNGQFRTSRHIIRFMVELMAPTPADRIIDPAAGTAGFLMEAGEFVRERFPEIETDAALRRHFDSRMFTGFDSDASMARIASMNLLLHGIENPVMERADSLAEGHPGAGEYTLVLANPPFAGSVDASAIAADLTRVVKTKKTELLFLARILQLLQNGGRAAVIVPDGVLFGSSKAHKDLRRMLVEDHKLDGVVKLPSGTFKPYTGVSTAILLFTKTSSGGTDEVWFYDVKADGFTLDDKRTPIEANDLPDALERWLSLSKPSPSTPGDRGETERARPRTAQSFTVPKQEIADNGYDLSINRYREIEHDDVEHRAPEDILDELDALEADIAEGLRSLRAKIGAGE